MNAWLDIRKGVLQASLLDHYSFHFHQRHLCLWELQDFIIILIADDTKLFYSHKNCHAFVIAINQELKEFTLWLSANKLFLKLNRNSLKPKKWNDFSGKDVSENQRNDNKTSELYQILRLIFWRWNLMEIIIWT